MIKGGLSTLVTRLSEETRNTVILASGDPLFYGIGSYLAKKARHRGLPIYKLSAACLCKDGGKLAGCLCHEYSWTLHEGLSAAY